jgi:hypothetical protein
MMKRLRFLRVVYLMPLLMLAFWPVNVNCQQCGDVVFTEKLMARIVSDWESNFLCNLACAQDYLDDHPIHRDSDGEIIRGH